MKGTCKLCLNETKLELSHVLPKFVFKWITKTSATNRLRSLGNPDKPMQDGNKMYLLCRNCEQRFSRFETWFALKFFHPSSRGLIINYDYDENLFKFVASLFWRTIVVNIGRKIYDETPLKSELISCEASLRDFLLNEKYPVFFDQMYIVMTSNVAESDLKIKGLNYYFTRTTDSQIIFDDTAGKMFFYCIIPYFTFVGNITGLNSMNFVNSSINPIGGHFLTTTMKLEEPAVTNFMRSQLNRISRLEISEAQMKIIEARILRDIDKYSDSKSFEAAFLDHIREN